MGRGKETVEMEPMQDHCEGLDFARSASYTHSGRKLIRPREPRSDFLYNL